MSTDLNSWNGTGRLTRDSEIKYTSGGQAVCKFAIAVNRSVKDGDGWKDEASFVDIVIWGKRAESLNQYLTKGKLVAIGGELHQNRWESDGKAMSKIEIVADKVVLTGEKQGDGKQSTPNQKHQPTGKTPPPPPPDGDECTPPDFPDDIPF